MRMIPQLLVMMLLANTALAGNEAVTLSSDDLLKPPASIKATPAAVPPVAQIILLADLPEGPRPTLWSAWGDGCIASNGRFYFAVGNHLDGAKGKGLSRLYEYDPKEKSLKLALDLRDVIPDPAIAAGKVHARIDQARDGWLYFATYWGKFPTEQEWKDGFKGSALLRYNPQTGKGEDLGIPVPGQGIPTSLMDSERMRIFAYAAKSGDFIVYDIAQRKVIFRGAGEDQEGSRNIMLGADGNAYFSGDEGVIWRYSAAENQVKATAAKLPAGPENPRRPGRGGSLRASSRQAASGLIYGVTAAGTLFSFDPKAEKVVDLGPTVGNEYTTVLEISPDSRFLYYAPGAHGSGSRIGTPIVQYDIARAKHKVLAFLNPLLREKLKYNIGGTYTLKIAPDGATLYAVFNGADLVAGARKETTFGRPSLVVLHIPEEERR